MAYNIFHWSHDLATGSEEAGIVGEEIVTTRTRKAVLLSQ